MLAEQVLTTEFPAINGVPFDSTITAAIQQITQHATIHSAPHHMMVVSKYNVRNKNTNNDELKALVRAHGVLQNLIGYIQLIDGVPTGVIEIVGGRRRHTVVGELIADGDLPEDYHLNYLLVTEAEAIEISLAENLGRVDMHPADVFEAMLALSKDGRSIEDIALTFRLEALEVKRRLKLANVSPRLFKLYRNDEADFRQMMALAISDDHAAQEQAWDALPKHNRSHHELRRLLTAQQIDITTDRLARFVGSQAYEKAGGVITRDLFSDNGAGYISDVALLEKLALAKLDKQREKLLKDGSGWVEILPRADYAMLSQYGQVRTTASALSADQQTWLASLEERIELLTERMELVNEDGDDDEYQRLDAECDELTAQVRAIKASRTDVPNPEDLALAGAVILIDHHGELVVQRNLIRPADKAKMMALPDAATEQAAPRRAKPIHSDRLTHELTSHRTAALQAEMMDQSDVALAFATYTLMLKVLPKYPASTLAKISLTKPTLANIAVKGAAAEAFETRKHQLIGKLPGNASDDDWLAWLLGQPQSVVLELLAYCVACSLDATQNREGDCPGYTVLAQALQLDMSKWWKPSAANYFNHVSKARMIAVVKGAVSDEAAVQLDKMKNAAAAEAAERALAHVAWLPEPMRAD
jgi:ParB family chromosome partitioning protein